MKVLTTLAAFAFLITTTPAVRADRIAELTPRQQFLQAELAIIGKVTQIEPDLVKASGVGYQVANVKISEALVGANGLTNVRIGFIPVANGGTPPNPRGFRGGFNLIADQECCFLLRRHPQADFYVYIPNGYPLEKRQPNFEADTKALRQMAGILSDPIAALKAKDAADRQFAACLLVLKYRTFVPSANGKSVQKAIPAEESKLILQTLATMEWGKFDPNGITNLSNVFYSLGMSERDGWKQPKPEKGQEFNKILATAASKWLTENAEKFRIQRFVRE